MNFDLYKGKALASSTISFACGKWPIISVKGISINFRNESLLIGVVSFSNYSFTKFIISSISYPNYFYKFPTLFIFSHFIPNFLTI